MRMTEPDPFMHYKSGYIYLQVGVGKQSIWKTINHFQVSHAGGLRDML